MIINKVKKLGFLDYCWLPKEGEYDSYERWLNTLDDEDLLDEGGRVKILRGNKQYSTNAYGQQQTFVPSEANGRKTKCFTM